MEKDKSRGLKHIKDKRKYKDNSRKNSKYIPPKHKQIESHNWHRYDKEDLDNYSFSNEINLPTHTKNDIEATSFELLSHVPISIGGHFESKRDKDIHEEVKNQRANSLFYLNLDVLQQGILLVPFNERVGIERTYFQDEELIKMDKEANEMSLKLLQSIEPTVEITKNSSSSGENLLISNSDEIRRLQLNEDLSRGVLSDGLKNNSIKPTKETVFTMDSRKDVDEDLDKWLDDILEN
ncbi:uncharacterized protein LOC132704782 [Cylas formicarius]|uniref:uncharacterized protein LOC132704782 n=1 Tax=Cylas formicarius TaxID=197179 RepID=UPI0029583BBE|nr:uncharacterized protein LOC132704782 [Cylas formicarius]